MPDSDAELVIQTRLPHQETNLLVASADDASHRFVDAGGIVIVPPQDIPVGRVTVVQDPWGNRLVLVDLSKGTYNTDEDANVTGVS